MSFDPMAAAVDWLDAYRAGDVETILGMHADDAVIHCGCGSMTTLTGREALRAYWVERLRQHPASKLDNIQPSPDGAAISYVTGAQVVDAVLTFNDDGQIKILACETSH